MRRSTHRWVATIALVAAPLSGQQATSLDQAIWSFPALRALRTTVTSDSLLAAALGACRSAAVERQREVTSLLRARAEVSTGAAADSLRDLATRHVGIPVTQLEAGCLLSAADSLLGLVNRPGTLARIEEVVGLLRSGRVAPERKEALRDFLARAATADGTLDERTMRREIDQRPIRDFLDAYAAREAALRPPPPPPDDPRRGPIPVSMTLPTRPPTKWPADRIEVTLTVEPSGEVSTVAIVPLIRDSADWRPTLEAFRKYRFQPALDHQGLPIQGTYVYTWIRGATPRKP